MDFKTIISQEINVDISQFWKGIYIWLNSPHTVNRRILASTKILTAEVQSKKSISLPTWKEKLHETCNIFKENPSNIDGDVLLNVFNYADIQVNNCSNIDITAAENKGIYIVVNKLLPRSTEKFSTTFELTILDKAAHSITYLHEIIYAEKHTLGLKWPYRIQFEDIGYISININNSENVENEQSIKWLKEQLFTRLIKWMMSTLPCNSVRVISLNLISSEKYMTLYNNLKKKYGTQMVKIWPETTDPIKFVYEDVAIATYLLLLWEKERIEKGILNKQSFVDLGCGNGLLVHILASEGHPGLGIDLRKRKIWDLFPKTTHLEVRTIVPSSSSLFPDTEWLIGNHSDELTPWIPVIAARSSYNCRFFLLPCCAYEFDGQKYQRDCAAMSQYSEYMQYLNNVCTQCGFKTNVDKLRIPSTKRICLIGWERTYSHSSSELQDRIIQEIIAARSAKRNQNFVIEKSAIHDQCWTQNFIPREVIEKVRNCTQLDKNLIADIVNIVTKELLKRTRMISIEGRPDFTWNAGGLIEINKIANMIPLSLLKQLKSECGGLQTLLKNNGHIFEVREGKVQFKMPGIKPIRNVKRKGNLGIIRKVKICWFHQNHPNGCPADEAYCNFKH
ncbi:probable tRNA (uracil-O(2)-)-methyltransferase isoform X1 [Cephus cinctus]|uniref:tRNA (uracil-O(2)-)-methyltransferase n=1 Tax=Cephus cinctus TaxID=211228 RepID=A0AAJ7BPT2_CEPCN|nr:probable tRNA (uracil-O(2)-)-methyltransferase isoform X1 [Cephus cinctus]